MKAIKVALQYISQLFLLPPSDQHNSAIFVRIWSTKIFSDIADIHILYLSHVKIRLSMHKIHNICSYRYVRTYKLH